MFSDINMLHFTSYFMETSIVKVPGGGWYKLILLLSHGKILVHNNRILKIASSCSLEIEAVLKRSYISNASLM